jgi:transposase
MKNQQATANRHSIKGKTIIAFDPAKGKHECCVLDPDAEQQLKSFSVAVSRDGFDRLIDRLQNKLPDVDLKDCVFAIETSCNLWQTLAQHLHSLGYLVVLVRPLATHHARPSITGDFSRTDPKDAFLIGRLAWQGSFSHYRLHDDVVQARHRLAIGHAKIRSSLQQATARLRALVELRFPEFLSVLDLDTLSAQYLLERYLLPQDYLQLNLDAEAAELERISRYQIGRDALIKLVDAARHSIGVPAADAAARAARQLCRVYLESMRQLKRQKTEIEKTLIEQTCYERAFHWICSLKGVSEVLASLFLAEVRCLEDFKHPGAIAKLAGMNLKVSDSGTYRGRRRLSHLGNPRLRWVLFSMASQAVTYVPEVRAKYLRRRLKHANRTKNVVACVPTLLSLITTMVRQERPYYDDPSTEAEVIRLEEAVRAKRTRRKKRLVH